MSDKENVELPLQQKSDLKATSTEFPCEILALRDGVFAFMLGTGAFYGSQEFCLSPKFMTQLGKMKYFFPPVGGMFIASIVGFDRLHTCKNRREARDEWLQYQRDSQLQQAKRL